MYRVRRGRRSSICDTGLHNWGEDSSELLLNELKSLLYGFPVYIYNYINKYHVTKVLQHVASRLRSEVRKTYTVSKGLSVPRAARWC